MKRIFDQRYAEMLSLDIISRELHINKYKLAKEFKSLYDVSPIDYLISIRIEAAKSLLIETRRTVTQIGIDIAIENTPYFVRLFKSHTGLTPLKYRLKYQKVLSSD
jgi:YesN/AraC family two-component response regulator